MRSRKRLRFFLVKFKKIETWNIVAMAECCGYCGIKRKELIFLTIRVFYCPKMAWLWGKKKTNSGNKIRVWLYFVMKNLESRREQGGATQLAYRHSFVLWLLVRIGNKKIKNITASFQWDNKGGFWWSLPALDRKFLPSRFWPYFYSGVRWPVRWGKLLE